MNVTATKIPGVMIIEPRIFEDSRGFFLETYNRVRFQAAGLTADFVQDNHSRSVLGTLRGLHYQIQHTQGKLVRVVSGEAFDVAVDLRRKSPTFGQWTATILSAANRHQFYLPPGVAHGFCALSECVDLLYKCTDSYYPEHERTILWDDPELAIDWPCNNPLLSEKDRQGFSFRDAPYFDADVEM